MTTEQLLTPQEVADELRIAKSTVLDLLRDGRLQHINLGHRTKRIRRSDLDRYLDECGAGGSCS